MPLIENKSDDHIYFTSVPNIVIARSRGMPVVKALYDTMKFLSKPNGLVDMGDNVLMKEVGCGKEAMRKAIQFMISEGWIRRGEKRLVKTKTRGMQMKNTYIITDIWSLNMAYFQRIPFRKHVIKKSKNGIDN